MSSNHHPFAAARLAGWRLKELIAAVNGDHLAQLTPHGERCLPRVSSPERPVAAVVARPNRIKGQSMAPEFVFNGVPGSRRDVARVLAGSALAGVAGRIGLVEESSAKRKRKNTKKKKVCYGSAPIYCAPPAEEPWAYCYPDGATCCTSAQGGGACPPGSECCSPSPLEPAGSCSPTGFRCCPAASGSYCPQFAPNCCPPTPQDPLGLCMPTGNHCCTAAQGGGFCRDDEACCPPSPGFPNGTCAPPGVPCPQRGDLAPARQGVRERRMEHPEGSVPMTTANGESRK